MSEQIADAVDAPNQWRLTTPGHNGWKRTAHASDPNKYFMVSADCHAMEPPNLWKDRLEKKFADRLPKIEIDANGVKWMVSEGWSRSRLLDVPLEGEDNIRNKSGSDPALRLQDLDRDGVDVEVIFPNRGLQMWATPDPEFADAQCRVFNDWAAEFYGPIKDRCVPMAAIATARVEDAVREIQRAAKLGFKGVTLPCKPIFGGHDPRHPNYNFGIYDTMWAAIQDANLAITFHVSTGRDPRAARKDGGAVINYVSHSLAPTIEPVANLCASGVIERFPKLRFASIEAGIGWVAWALHAMDEAYLKHHMWAYPKLKQMPSEYFHSNGFSSFQEDPAGLDLAEKHNLARNFMWANDYPHHEGSWPHSAEAIERQMGHLSEESRANILGLNAARCFNLDVRRRVPMPSSN
ncbi:MAG TPA: amidohydrolase family protein [Candidatus Binataceae bacterium]|nr:amidohydrolase family protein [Candidatus Binataceae bacterium]